MSYEVHIYNWEANEYISLGWRSVAKEVPLRRGSVIDFYLNGIYSTLSEGKNNRTTIIVGGFGRLILPAALAERHKLC